MQNSSRHESLLTLFCKLGRELYCSWFGKCAGVYKPLIPTPKHSAKLLSCLTFRNSYLLGGKDFSYLWDHMFIVKMPQKDEFGQKAKSYTSPKESFLPSKEKPSVLVQHIIIYNTGSSEYSIVKSWNYYIHETNNSSLLFGYSWETSSVDNVAS